MSEEDPRTSLIATFTRVVRQVVVDDSLARDAEQLAIALVDELGRQHGCDRLYIPALPNSDKREAVLSDFNGSNGATVCRKHGISRSTLYRYIQGSKT